VARCARADGALSAAAYLGGLQSAGRAERPRRAYVAPLNVAALAMLGGPPRVNLWMVAALPGGLGAGFVLGELLNRLVLRSPCVSHLVVVLAAGGRGRGGEGVPVMPMADVSGRL
jgi:hypothetical protein